MLRFKIVTLFCFVVYFSGYTQTIITDRPDQTESSSTINRGSLQIESGVLLGFSEDNLSSERQLLAPTTLFRYGVSKSLEIRVVSQFESLKENNSSNKINGISDLEIGTKIQLLKKENVNTEIAFLSHINLPTGSISLTNNSFGTINKLSISHELSNTMLDTIILE